MLKLKDMPMTVQIWIILGLVLGLSYGLVAVLAPVVLKYSFTNETYARITESQEYIIKYLEVSGLDSRHPIHFKMGEKPEPPPFRIVRHVILPDSIFLPDGELPYNFLQQVKKEALNQKEEIKNYVKRTDNMEMFYVIRQLKIDGKDISLISYLGERYRDNLVRTTFEQLIALIIFILITSWIASIATARYLTSPLVKLQSSVKEIARRKWEGSVSLERGDEIGQLAEAIDWMRVQLLEQDQKQQSFLQQISHELKTPIMVIRSYVQSINDGIFPRGNMENSLHVIEEETERLEKRVHFLLDLTKYEYLSNQQLEKAEFDFKELVRKVSRNYVWRRSDINWDFDLGKLIIKADQEKVRIVLENLFDNQIRYAVNTIRVSLKKNVNMENLNLNSKLKEQFKSEINSFTWVLRIWNDGPEIKPGTVEKVFKKYAKGYEGNFGLGLAIVKLIIEQHNWKINVNNEGGGVAFYIWI